MIPETLRSLRSVTRSSCYSAKSTGRESTKPTARSLPSSATPIAHGGRQRPDCPTGDSAAMAPPTRCTALDPTAHSQDGTPTDQPGTPAFDHPPRQRPSRLGIPANPRRARTARAQTRRGDRVKSLRSAGIDRHAAEPAHCGQSSSAAGRKPSWLPASLVSTPPCFAGSTFCSSSRSAPGRRTLRGSPPTQLAPGPPKPPET